MIHLRILSASLLTVAVAGAAEPVTPPVPTTAAAVADAALAAVAVWDGGAATCGSSELATGTPVAAGTAVETGRTGPGRLVLPGTVHGVVTVAAGSRFVLQERRVDAGGQSQGELILILERGGIEISGDLTPRYAGARIRASASETVVNRNATVVAERDAEGDTLVAVDGTAVTGPLPQAANGWQAIGERVQLAEHTTVRVTTANGVGEPAAAAVRPQLVGTAAERLTVRAQARLDSPGREEDLGAYRGRYGADAWSLDAAGRSLGSAAASYWASPVAPTRDQAVEHNLSGVAQVSGFRDSNPTSVPTEVGDGTADSAISFYGDLRWTCWRSGDLSLRLQGVGSVVRYRDTPTVNAAQGGGSAALLGKAGDYDWSVGAGGVLAHTQSENRRVGRVSGDWGKGWGDRDYGVINLGLSHTTVVPTDGSESHTSRAVTARPAWIHSWPGEVWTPSTEWSLLYTDSRSAVATDDYYALRPGLTWLNRIGPVDVTLAARTEYVAYRDQRFTGENGLGRELVSQVSGGIDWWFLPWWSAGVFANRMWFVSNQELSSYTDTQAGVRTTVTW